MLTPAPCALALAIALAAPARGPAGAAAAAPEARPVRAVRAEAGDCAFEVAFDPRRIPEARLRKLLRLRHGWEGSWLAEFAAVNALPWLDPLDAVAAAVPRMRAVLARFEAELRHLQPPPELAPVIAWTREDMAYQLWLVRTELEFCRNGDPAVLARPLGELETPARCAEEIWLVDESLLGQCRAASLSWGSCVGEVFRARHGAFPEDAWQAFLRADGLDVREMGCDGR